MKNLFKKSLLIFASFSLVACGNTTSGTTNALDNGEIVYQSGSLDTSSADASVESKVEAVASEKGDSVSDPTSAVSSFESNLDSDSFTDNFTVSINMVVTTSYEGKTLNVSGNELIAFDGKNVYFYVNSADMDSEESYAMEAVFIANASNGYDCYAREGGDEKFVYTVSDSDDDLTSSIDSLISEINSIVTMCAQAIPYMSYDSSTGAYSFSQTGISMTLKFKDDKLAYIATKIDSSGSSMVESMALTNYGTTKVSAPDASLVTTEAK